MNGYLQAISIEEHMKKILFSILIISTLSFVLLWGIKYGGSDLASLFDVIVARVTINPLEVKVSAPSRVKVGKIFKVEARLVNKGEEEIKDTEAEIFLPSGLTLIKKDLIQRIGVIRGKKGKKVSWLVRGEKMGIYIITVSGRGELKGQTISAEDSTKVEIRESLKGFQAITWFQDFLNFFGRWLKP